MIYREYLVMRKALLWFFAVLVGLFILALLLVATGQHSGSNTQELNTIALPGAWAVCIFAAIFGVALGNASREPARVIWVLPSDRWKLALQILAVDAIGMAVAFVGTTVLALAFPLAMGFFMPSHLTGSIDWNVTLQGLLFVFAIYGWSALVGMLGRRAAFAGIASLPLLMMWTMFASSGGDVGVALRAPIAANPFAVFTSGFMFASPGAGPHLGAVGESLRWMANGWEAPVLAATVLATCAVAVVLWQRSEVLA